MYRCAFFRQRGYVRGTLVSHIVAGGLALCVDGKPAFRADVVVAERLQRELLLLVGNEELIAQMTQNNRRNKRYSGLRFRLQGEA